MDFLVPLVAALAVLSTDYYTRLEQQRGPQPSEQMLAALARALRLTGAERDYLFQIAGHNPPAAATPATHVARARLRVPDRLSDTPALIVSSLGETLVQNGMAAALFGDKSGYAGLARSEIYRWFTDPAEQLRYPDEDRDRPGRSQVANLRAACGSMGPNSRAGELVRALQTASAEFAGLWDRHEVAKRFADHKTLIHPELGRSRSTARCCSPRTSLRRCSCSPHRREPRATKSCSCSRCWGTSTSPRRN
jgi:MmyB-like transcription regulator ligand binding domain/Helix-turn-helix domain